MQITQREEIEQLREEFPDGTRVVLEYMNDEQAPPVGTKGTVLYVDDAGDLVMKWDNGNMLNVILEEDRVRKL